jgi:branched-chain amino acid transport system permease protein
MKKKNKLIVPIVAGLLAFAAYVALLFISDGGYVSNFLVYICLFIIAAHGWNLLGGYVGEISFGHAVFWGIGAYTVGLPIGYDLPIPPLVLVFVGALVAAGFAWLISYPQLRVQGFPFLIGKPCIVTVGFRILKVNFACRNVKVTANDDRFSFCSRYV